jgi:hypothetical protein
VIGYLDCYSGLGGDMFLGALVDAGFPFTHLQDVVSALGLGDDVRLEAETVTRRGLRATQVRVEVLSLQVGRTLSEVTSVVHGARLSEAVQRTSLDVLDRLVSAEARVHGRPAAQVRLHEVGSVDCIVDVVGAVAGLAELGIDELYASALPVTPGEVLHGAEGRFPGPAPATLELLATSRAPVRPFGEGRELITPTGAALVTTLARFEQPAMRLEAVGYGAGSQDTPWPNVVRLWLGPGLPERSGRRDVVVVETNLDDITPQLLAPVSDALFAAGALDVTVTPVLMKKGRPGWRLSVIARPDDEASMADLVLRETTTLGVRAYQVRRYEAGRRVVEVATPYGAVAIKLKLVAGAVVGALPEFESVRTAAAAAHAPLAAVHAAASAAAGALVPAPATEGGGAACDA